MVHAVEQARELRRQVLHVAQHHPAREKRTVCPQPPPYQREGPRGARVGAEGVDAGVFFRVEKRLCALGEVQNEAHPLGKCERPVLRQREQRAADVEQRKVELWGEIVRRDRFICLRLHEAQRGFVREQ